MLNSRLAKLLLLTLSLLATLAPVSKTWAHGGASVDADTCRILVGPHIVHFTAYQPQISGTTEYCDKIPDLGQATIVFDYEGKALRNMTVEVEITKEPGGTRFFYIPPSTHSTGSFNTTLNFTETGSYLTHVTLINEGQKIDAHIPFKVGSASTELSSTTILVIVVVLGAIGYIFYLSNAGFKALIDRLIGNKSKA
ncbi:hypothetical protein [Methylococcus sp. EFPC2]|uniref:hypothetical protein n=1 Tax=Methylococcus sp. EFPC2 TaxID=2812648 RepID=UPI001967AEF6|nr:hypothetical protein [Methylococcus sp. EFPC2]QSA98245.1 hypothetical protein JWZ97_05360 [Methylococcus sp. EFPC2]